MLIVVGLNHVAWYSLDRDTTATPKSKYDSVRQVADLKSTHNELGGHYNDTQSKPGAHLPSQLKIWVDPIEGGLMP